ncbi:MAG: glycoside hydrolase family 18 protein [Deltaproteobacteria bacterium]|nr:glycoside hydrolase family 18 protein [Deltaproteobacteria bacterium]
MKILPCAALLLPLLAAGCALWRSADDVRDGRHDRGRNALWLQHGWLGDDAGFARNGRARDLFRGPGRASALAAALRENRITDVFPHLCPSDPAGPIAAEDRLQTERFLDAFAGFRVLPWVGGVKGRQAFPDDPSWRIAFAQSVAALLTRHPRLAGIHLDVEPCPSGDEGLLALLADLRAALPPGKILSVAGPPPPAWPVFRAGHWSPGYWRRVMQGSDQVAVMLYDTGVRHPWLYRRLVAAWTGQVLAWAGRTQVLLGVPGFDQGAPGRHDPAVENLAEALPAVHAGLSRLRSVPESYQGLAIYCEWEMDEEKWGVWRERFRRP